MGSNGTNENPVTLQFEAEPDSKIKKGAHRPVFAPIFTQPPAQRKAPKRLHLLVNPYAGKRRGRATADKAKLLFEEAGVNVEFHVSSYSGHLVELAQNLELKKGDAIAVVGGDGSFSEVITGHLQSGSSFHPIFGLIPSGTGNSQAHDLGLKDLETAIQTILGGQTQTIDLARVQMAKGLPGHVNGKMVRYSHNLVTWGLGVDSTLKAEKMRWMGPIRYDVGILMAIMANNRRQATLTLDGKEMEGDYTLFLIQNSQTGGSLLPLAPGASLDDGLMDIGILKKMTRRGILKAFGMLKSEGRHVFHPRVDYHRFTTLSIETPTPAAINVDGENIGSTPLNMEVIPQAIEVFTPSLE